MADRSKSGDLGPMDFLTPEGLLKQVALILPKLVHKPDPDPHELTTAEQCVLQSLHQLHAAGTHPETTLATVKPALQALIDAAEVTGYGLSNETEGIIATFKNVGITFEERAARAASHRLADAPKAPIGYSVFVDESGSGSFNEATQPVFCMVGVVFRDDHLAVFERESKDLLRRFGVREDLEIHTGEWLSNRKVDPVPELDREQRVALLLEFLALGMKHADAIHHLSMVKGIVKDGYRQKLAQQKLDAHTSTVVWFTVTLDRGLMPIVLASGGYKFFYDEHSNKDIARIYRALGAADQAPKLKLIAIKGIPQQLTSDHRGIQLADVAAYYLNRYRDFEVRSIPQRKGLDKHEATIRAAHALIKPKLVDYISKDLWRLWDPKALADFTLKPDRKPPAK